ncbi:ImmA/IrrE family metallo-endopeptidase [Peribacillus sp. SIMBA_075]|uniref:ImmA/IrrE family metallo-endopeptidase n=1 Tax=Peribacillus sp. SIMBA_075 TaxID=3085813 RepID=UPI00397A5F14
MKIKAKVKRLILEFGENDPFKLAKALGVHVEFENLGKIYGYYINLNEVPIIKINENISHAKQFFTCCHELSHYVLHPNVNTPFLTNYTLFCTDTIEREAHSFALELLYSNKKILSEDDLLNFGIPEQIAYSRQFISSIN